MPGVIPCASDLRRSDTTFVLRLQEMPGVPPNLVALDCQSKIRDTDNLYLYRKLGIVNCLA